LSSTMATKLAGTEFHCAGRYMTIPDLTWLLDFFSLVGRQMS